MTDAAFDPSVLEVTLGISEFSKLRMIYDEYLQNLEFFLSVAAQPTLDFEKLYIEVHKLKASSRSVGAGLLADLIVELERSLLRNDSTEDISARLVAVIEACNLTIAAIRQHILNQS